MSKRMFGLLAAVLVLATVAVGFGASAASAKDEKGGVILSFEHMAGVSRPYTGAANAIRGVNGGGLPWVINAAKGELKKSGELEIKVYGLVIDPNDAAAIAAGRAGTNPAATFKAIVSCQSTDATGKAVIVNVTTGEFPATTGLLADGAGNAEIEAHVDLPKPCIAPIVFVTSATGSWFAATGN